MAGRIALIDDDADFTDLVGELLREHGWQIVVCHDDDVAVQCVREERPDLIIIDVRMQTRDSGWHILEELQRDRDAGCVPAIVCSAAIDDLNSRAAWMREHGVAPLQKPFDIDDLLRLVETMLRGDPPSNSSSPPIVSNGGKQQS